MSDLSHVYIAHFALDIIFICVCHVAVEVGA